MKAPKPSKVKIESQKDPKILSENKTYEVFQQSIDKYFKNVSVNTANYLQSVSDLQLEIIESRKKNAKSVILLQTYLTRKTNSDVKLPEESLQIVADFTEQTNKAWNFQNQLMIKSLEALSKNIQAFNENSDAFAGMNKELIKSWASIIKERTKNKE
jgi:hypothetical protein